MSSKWQRTLGAHSILQDEMQSPVEDSEVVLIFFVLHELYYTSFSLLKRHVENHQCKITPIKCL